MTLKDLWNKLDVIAVIGFLIALEQQITTGSMSFAHTLPDVWIPVVKEWAANLASVGGLMIGILRMSSNPGAPSSITSTVLKVVIAALLLSIFLFSPAMAQTQRVRANPPADATTPAQPDATDTKCALIWDPLKLCGKLTGNAETDLKRVADRIRQVKKDDLAYAILKAKKASTPTSGVRLQCMTAVQDAASAWDGDQIKDSTGAVIPRPDPALITGIEDIAELVDALSPQGALFASCAGAAQMFAVGTLQVINSIVTGAALIIPKA